MVDWRVLHRCAELDEARRLTVAVLAMEFDARVQRASGGGAVSLDPAEEDGTGGPFVVEVPAEDAGDLAPLVGEILSEQDEFDAAHDASRGARDRTLRWVIGAGVLAAAAYYGYTALRLAD